ncbi:SLOG family protein [Thalassobacillus hwangdonensis]|uniref:UPF0398 protein ACFQ2J_04435 n=1 Tax=Thalassobacillus hwangdonensis TaxID=546108 RepID=A0ABW3KX36_9BACI
MKTLVVTGYKQMELGIFKQDDQRIMFIKAALKKRLLSLIEEGLEWVLVSGQMGVELWTAEVVMDLKESHDIKLAILPPFTNQEDRWPEQLKMKYEELTLVADFYKPVHEQDYKAPYQFRQKDQFLIEHSDGALLLYDTDTPGSPDYFRKMAMDYQEKGSYPIYYITPMDLEDIVEEIRMADPDYWAQ